jgi:hypothetical protein
MIGLSLSVFDVETRAVLGALEGKELDKAIVRTLNLAAYQIQKDQRATLDSRFTIRTPSAKSFLSRMIKVETAKRAKPQARVYIEGPGKNIEDKRARGILTRHEEGGTVGVKGSPFYIGASQARNDGLLKRGMYPKALGFGYMRDANQTPYVPRGRGSFGGQKRGNKLSNNRSKGKRDTFLIPGVGIFLRRASGAGMGRGTDNITLLWRIRRDAIHIRPTLRFQVTTQRDAPRYLAAFAEQAVADVIRWRKA